jgi:hypothetical protein
MIEVELALHCPGCASVMVPDAVMHRALVPGAPRDYRPIVARLVRVRPGGGPCPRCGAAMSRAGLSGDEIERCDLHGCFVTAQDADGLHELVQVPKREVIEAWPAEIARALGDTHLHGDRLVAMGGGTPISIDAGEDMRLRVAIPALAGVRLVATPGDRTGGDAETGDSTFDREWKVLGPEPAVAPLVLPGGVRYLLRQAPARVTIDHGELAIDFQRDFDLAKVTSLVRVCREVAAVPQALDGELRGVAAALNGTVRGSAWTWRGGFTASVPCGRALAALEVALDARERLVTRLVADGSSPAGWGMLALRLEYTSGAPWLSSRVPGYVMGGEVAADAELVQAAKPASIEVGANGNPAPRCELVWRGWPPGLDQLRAGLRLAADLLGDASASAGPYR